MSSSARLENPYSRHPNTCWLKGGLHAHTNRSDGRATPEQRLWLDLVRRHGGFAAIVRSVDDARAAIARAEGREP